MEHAHKKCNNSIPYTILTFKYYCYSYKLMLSCWHKCPGERPVFENLVISVNTMINIIVIDLHQ